MFKKRASVLAFLVAVGAAQAALAVQPTKAESLALNGVTVSVADAVSSAEAKGQGKVVELALTGNASQPVYDVTMQRPDGTESNFIVNAKTGAITPSTDVADNQGSSTEPGEQEDGGSDGGESGESGSN